MRPPRIPCQRVTAIVGKPVGLCQGVIGRFFSLNYSNLRPDKGVPAVPGLIEALKNPSRETRQLAAGTLADIGPSASDAVPALTKALEDEDAGVRETAEYALKEINTTEPATH